MDGKKKKLPKLKPERKDPETSRRDKGDCFPSASTSHTQYFRRPRHDLEPQRITTDEYFGVSESLSGSSSNFGCVKKDYTLKGLQKKFFVKELDPVPLEKKWTDTCPPGYGWVMASKLAFLVSYPSVLQQKERLIAHISDLATTARKGYRVDCLNDICLVMHFLIEALPNHPELRESITQLLHPMSQPIILLAASDIVSYFDNISAYIGLMGYLLMRLSDDDHFKIVENAVSWMLSAPDSVRPINSPHLRTLLAAAAPVLTQTITRMIAIASTKRMKIFLKLAFMLACDSFDNCVNMMKEGIIENIMYRFNPYFPDRDLPSYDTNPDDPEDLNVCIGSTHVHLTMTMSLMLVLGKTIVDHHIQHPEFDRLQLPCPDNYAQRCFLWVFRYECRARDHKHSRVTLTVIASVLLQCYGKRLKFLSEALMPDVMSLSVLTEIPPCDIWMNRVTINTSRKDTHFKKMLIQLSVHFLKVFPHNKSLVMCRHWAVGLIYLIDPGLSCLRPQWSPALYSELRKLIFQALITVLPICAVELSGNINLVRRLMWYIEWYSESPYDIGLLYWCMRLLHVTTFHAAVNQTTVKDLFESHGLIIFIEICNTLLQQKQPLVSQIQTVLAVAVRLLSCGISKLNVQVTCCVYPHIVWPISVYQFSRNMLDIIQDLMEKNFYISERWFISLLYFIWEAIIWNPAFRDEFIEKDGIYNLLDIVTMSKPAVQCIALAMICDATRAGTSVGQLVTWRASLAASHAHPGLVKRGANISALLAAIFRDECKATGVKLDHNGVITDLDNPIMSMEVRKAIRDEAFMTSKSPRTPVCYAAADIAGSRLSKTFAILYLLSEDLHYKVTLANEAYKLYNNIELQGEDEATLILCAYYLTMKLNEVWTETRIQSSCFLPEDEEIFEEFLEISRGWSKEIKRMQDDVFESRRCKERNQESTLFAFLARVRLNVALDALREVRCMSRSANRKNFTHHSLLYDAVKAHHRRSSHTKKLGAPILRTYEPKFDEQNITGQNLKIISIIPKDMIKKRSDYPPSHSSEG